jgi:hypothetical protein
VRQGAAGTPLRALHAVAMRAACAARSLLPARREQTGLATGAGGERAAALPAVCRRLLQRRQRQLCVAAVLRAPPQPPHQPGPRQLLVGLAAVAQPVVVPWDACAAIATRGARAAAAARVSRRRQQAAARHQVGEARAAVLRAPGAAEANRVPKVQRRLLQLAAA